MFVISESPLSQVITSSPWKKKNEDGNPWATSMSTCPVCVEFSVKDIYQCRGGMIVCKGCHREVAACQWCSFFEGHTQQQCYTLQTLVCLAHCAIV